MQKVQTGKFLYIPLVTYVVQLSQVFATQMRYTLVIYTEPSTAIPCTILEFSMVKTPKRVMSFSKVTFGVRKTTSLKADKAHHTVASFLSPQRHHIEAMSNHLSRNNCRFTTSKVST